MDKATLIRSLKQLCAVGQHKLDIAVKPTVIIKEHRQSLERLKQLVDLTICSYKEKAVMYQMIRKMDGMNHYHSSYAGNLRQHLISLERLL